jgi:hypothetical protein
MSDQCRDVLVQGVFNEFKFTDESQYREAIKIALQAEDEILRKRASGEEVGLDISIPLAKKILEIGAQAGREKEELEYVKKMYKADTARDVDLNTATWVSQKIASKTIIDAWRDCMIKRGGGLQMELIGDERRDFLLVLNHTPSQESDPDLVISGVTLSGPIQMSGSINLAQGRTIGRFSSLSQAFSRTGREAAAIAIDFSGAPGVQRFLPPGGPDKEIKLFSFDIVVYTGEAPPSDHPYSWYMANGDQGFWYRIDPANVRDPENLCSNFPFAQLSKILDVGWRPVDNYPEFQKNCRSISVKGEGRFVLLSIRPNDPHLANHYRLRFEATAEVTR